MRKLFGLITICSVLAFPVLAAKPLVSNPVAQSLPATDIHLVKKAPLPLIIGEVKGKPDSPPGQNKDKNGGSERAATGVLGASATGEKYAIIIGICDYPGTKNDICNSDGDSLNMYKALTTLYGYDPDNIYLFKDYGGTYFEENEGDDIPTITARKPTRKNILNAISELKNKKATSSEDEIVFFFSGHGADGIAQDGDSERRDEGMVVHNNDSTDIDYIWDGELKTAFTGFATNRIAFVFDTCLAGGMNDLADTGRVISMATSESQVAYVYTKEGDDVDGDGQLDGEGVFTHFFVNEGMLQGLADVYDHGQRTNPDVLGEDVVVEEAFDYAKEMIDNSSYKRQKPTISDKFENDLLL